MKNKKKEARKNREVLSLPQPLKNENDLDFQDFVMNPSAQKTKKKIHGRENSIKYMAKVKQLEDKTTDRIRPKPKFALNEGKLLDSSGLTETN